jgi:hypothetical protein
VAPEVKKPVERVAPEVKKPVERVAPEVKKPAERVVPEVKKPAVAPAPKETVKQGTQQKKGTEEEKEQPAVPGIRR